MKTLIKVMLIIFSVLIIMLLLAIYNLSTIKIRDTKDFSHIYVDDIFNYEMMISPPKKYEALNQIDFPMRKKVAGYMKENNYILKKGKQEFVRNNPTFEELIGGFVFENYQSN